MMRVTILTFALLFLFVFTLGAQDLTILSKVTRDGGSPETSASYISRDHLRMVQPEGNDVIFDLKSGDMTVIEGKKKTYYVVTKKDMDSMAAMMKERMNSPEMKQAQEQMKNLPPEMQERMKAAMGDMFSVDVKKTDESRTIAGYRCDEWQVTIGTISRSTQCMTTAVKLPEQIWDGYRSYMENFRSMMQAMGPMAKSMEDMAEKMKKMKGFPLANTTTTSVMGHKSTTTSEVTSIKEGSIPASAWEVPAGYKKVDSPMKKAMERQRG